MLESPDPLEFSPCPTMEEAKTIAARAGALVSLGDAERARIIAVTRRLGAETAGIVESVGKTGGQRIAAEWS